MNTPFGFQGAIWSSVAFDGPTDTFTVDGITMTVEGGVFSVGYQREDQEQEARRLVAALIEAWMFRHNAKLSVDFNQSWRVEADRHRSVFVNLQGVARGTATAYGMVTVRDEHGNDVTQVINPYSFANDQRLAENAYNDHTLATALRYFVQEVIEDERPLYGIYKAIEEVTEHLAALHNRNRHKRDRKDGRQLLAALVGKSEGFVGDLMETTQLQRHARTPARRRLSNEECHARAKMLIEAYAQSL